MIGPTGAARVMLTTRPVDFRKGTEGLAALVRKEMQADPIRLWRGLSVPRQARGPAKLVVYPRLGRFFRCSWISVASPSRPLRISV